MKKNILLILAFLLIPNIASANVFIDQTLDGYRMKIIKYDLQDPSYEFKIGVNLDYHASSLKELLLKYNGISGVNGVFLCPADYTECGGKNFTHNERYFKGHKVSGNSNDEDKRSTFAITKNNTAFIYKKGKINTTHEKDIYYGFGNFPLILANGEDKVWKNLHYKMAAKSKKNFICSDKNSTFIKTGFIYTISVADMPKLLKKMGCHNALHLDAGATSSMVYNGKQIIGPGRPLLDGVVIERKGLDTKDITKRTQVAAQKFDSRMKNIKTSDKLSKTKKIISMISKMKQKMYQKNSTDIFDENEKKIGYKITMNQLKKLQIMYLLNTLEYEFQKLRWKYKVELEKEKNTESGLF